MASLNSLQARVAAAQGVVGRVVDDTPVAIRIKHVDTCAVTSVIVITGTNIILIDADGTTTSTFATDTTVGMVRDRINASTNWEAKVLDALRADASASMFVNGTITISADGYYDVLYDTSAIKAYTYRLTYDREVGGDKGKLTSSHRVHLKKITYFADVNAAAVNGVRIYKCKSDGKGTTETQIWQATSVDITETTALDLTAAADAKITAPEGYDLVVRVRDATSLADHASGNLQVVGILE